MRTLVEAERQASITSIFELQEKLRALPEYATLSETQQQEIDQNFDQFRDDLENRRLAAVIRESLRNFQEYTYPSLLTKITNPVELGSMPSEDEPAIQYVNIHYIPVAFPRPFLSNTTDIDEFLLNYRESLIAAVESGKRIQV